MSLAWKLLTSLPAILVIAWLAGRLLGIARSWAATVVAGASGWLAALALSLAIAGGARPRPDRPGPAAAADPRAAPLGPAGQPLCPDHPHRGEVRLPVRACLTMSGYRRRARDVITMHLLVRHAHAGNKRLWTGPDADRPLSIRGWQEAEGLAGQLAGFPITRLLTSPLARCRQTLRPLAGRLGCGLELLGALAVDGDVEELLALLAAGDSDNAVLCTHGEVLGALLTSLRDRGAIDFEGDGVPRSEKGSAWILDGHAGRFRARYLPPTRAAYADELWPAEELWPEVLRSPARI